MKKRIAACFILVMLFSLCACARQNVNSTEPQTSGTTVSTTAAPPAWQWQKDSPQNQGQIPLF